MGGDLYAGHKAHAQRAALFRRLVKPRYRVVVGDGDELHAEAVHMFRRLARSLEPVRGGGVDVQVRSHSSSPADGASRLAAASPST